jgi:osmotically-inducible protein OsmY
MRRYAVGIGVAAFVCMAGLAGAADKEWRPDDYVSMKIQIGAYEIPELDPSRISVEAKDGNVTLRGTAPSQAASTALEQLARGVDGVKQVTNAVQIAPAAAGDAPAPAARSDEAIKEDLVQLISTDAELRDSEVAITSVRDGTVVLGGYTASLADQLHALRITDATAGVVAVRNEMKAPQNTTYDIDMGSGQSIGRDSVNRRERMARDGRQDEPPAGEAGDAPPIDPEEPQAPQANPDAAGNMEPEGETTY